MRPLTSSLALLVLLVAACSDSVGPRATSCARGTLGRAAPVTGTIANSSCTAAVGGARLAHADYDVDLIQGERYMFTVRSTDAWKPLLELRDPATGALVEEGWVTGSGETGSSAEVLYVAPQTGRFTLRVAEGDAGAGSYSLRSQSCGGSSTEIFSAQAIGVLGTIDAADCVLHDRWLDADSARAETFVVYVNRGDTRRVTLAGRGASAASFVGALVIVGPFERNASGATRAMASGASSVSYDLRGPSDKGGTYMIVAAGEDYTRLGDFSLTVGPVP